MGGVSEVRRNGRIVGHALTEPSTDPGVDYVAHIIWTDSPEATSPASGEEA